MQLALGVLGIIVGVVAVVASCLLNSWVTMKHEHAWFAKPVILLTAPGCVIALFVLAVLLTPYFWVYPERHAHIIDFRGTAKQKEALAEYRRACKKRGLFRRFLEKIHLAKDSRPEWPEVLKVQTWEDEEDSE